MSKKHVNEYYEKICADYKEMLDTLRDMEEEYSKNLISPDRLEQIKEMIKPMKENYERISYIMYLFNMPDRKRRKEKYIKQTKQIFTKNIEEIQKEDRQVIDSLKTFI